MTPTPILTEVTTKGLDYGYMALAITVLIALGSALVYATNRQSKFNTENLPKKQATTDVIDKKIYKAGTAPLVLAVSTFLYEELLSGFSAAHQRVIEKYEDARLAAMNPSDPAFIDVSNLPESLDYHQKINDLVVAHSISVQHETQYKRMRRFLDLFNGYCWLPLCIVVASLAVHIGAFLIYNDTTKSSDLVQNLFAIGLVASLGVFYFYLQYKRCDRKLDNFGVDDD